MSHKRKQSAAFPDASTDLWAAAADDSDSQSRSSLELPAQFAPLALTDLEGALRLLLRVRPQDSIASHAETMCVTPRHMNRQRASMEAKLRALASINPPAFISFANCRPQLKIAAA